MRLRKALTKKSVDEFIMTLVASGATIALKAPLYLLMVDSAPNSNEAFYQFMADVVNLGLWTAASAAAEDTIDYRL